MIAACSCKQSAQTYQVYAAYCSPKYSYTVIESCYWLLAVSQNMHCTALQIGTQLCNVKATKKECK